jgi:hypothetical protein
MPGSYGAYALVMAILGQAPTGKHLVDRTTGVIAAVSFAVLSVSQSLQGMSANAEYEDRQIC